MKQLPNPNSLIRNSSACTNDDHSNIYKNTKDFETTIKWNILTYQYEEKTLSVKQLQGLFKSGKTLKEYDTLNNQNKIRRMVKK